VLTVTLWVKAFLVAALRLQGYDEPWWLELLREPVTVALMAALTVSLVIWQLLAPMGMVWRMAYRAGRSPVELDGGCDDPSGVLLPFIPPQRAPKTTPQRRH